MKALETNESFDIHFLVSSFVLISVFAGFVYYLATISPHAYFSVDVI